MHQSSLYHRPSLRLVWFALWVDIIAICLILPMIVLTDQISRVVCGVLAVIVVVLGTGLLIHPERWVSAAPLNNSIDIHSFPDSTQTAVLPEAGIPERGPLWPRRVLTSNYSLLAESEVKVNYDDEEEKV